MVVGAGVLVGNAKPHGVVEQRDLARCRRHGFRLTDPRHQTTIERSHEARLALGVEIHDALKPMQRSALRGGLIPAINQMSAAGITTLPGMMTGQILAGADPLEADKYQVLIMFLLAGGSGIGAVAAVYLAVRRVTDDRDRLRLDRLA